MPLDPFIAKKVEPLWGIDHTAAYTADPGLWENFEEAFSDNRPYDLPQVQVHDVEIPGDHPCRVRTYTPLTEAAAPRRALVWAHGGGFVAGTLDDHEADTVSREVCAAGDVVVVSVDYPLADGGAIRYPVLHRSLIAAFEWTLAHTQDLGVDPRFVSLGGASAGGNLTVAAALELRETGRELPAGLVLVYPALSRTHMTSEAHEALMREVPPLLRFEQQAIEKIFNDYTGDAEDTTYVSFETRPLGELPPMLVVLSEYDDLRVPVEVILDRPEHQSLDVERYFAAGAPHGHLSMLPLVPETRATLDRIAGYLRR